MITFECPQVFSLVRSIVGEGPLWDSRQQMLYYTDITGKKLHAVDWITRSDTAIELPEKAGFLALTVSGGLVLGMESGVFLRGATGDFTRIHPDFPIAGERFNDGKVGPDGRLYAGTLRREGGGCLYRIEPDGSVSTAIDDVRISNGLDWSMDGKTLFYCDTATHRIEAFDFDISSGSLSNRRTVLQIPNEMGSPDGMTIDRDDRLWVALWNGSGIIQVDPPSGNIVGYIPVPAKNTSCCTFAGPDLEDLIITTASLGADAQSEPLAGCVFIAHNRFFGREPYRF